MTYDEIRNKWLDPAQPVPAEGMDLFRDLMTVLAYVRTAEDTVKPGKTGNMENCVMTYDKKKAEVRRLSGNVDLITDNLVARDNICWLILELERAWAALEFYADKKTYANAKYDALNGDGGFFPYDANDWEICNDEGKRAREALDE